MNKLVLMLALTTCGPIPSPNVPPDPSDPAARQANCAAAQKRLTELGCRERVTPSGKTYEKFCIEQINKGNTMNAACVATIKECDEINVCTGSR